MQDTPEDIKNRAEKIKSLLEEFYRDIQTLEQERDQVIQHFVEVKKQEKIEQIKNKILEAM